LIFFLQNQTVFL